VSNNFLAQLNKLSMREIAFAVVGAPSTNPVVDEASDTQSDASKFSWRDLITRVPTYMNTCRAVPIFQTKSKKLFTSMAQIDNSFLLPPRLRSVVMRAL
jgi:hypothetical protein